MPDITIPNPENRQWGNGLQRTYNIDLETEPGKITLSKRVEIVADSESMALSAAIDVFKRTDADNTDRWWALERNGQLLRTDSQSPYGTWAADTLANSPTDGRDMEVHETDTVNVSSKERLLVTRDTDIASLNDSGLNTWNLNWWITTKGQPALLSKFPHPIDYFPLRRISIIGDANFIHTVDKNGAVSNKRLILPAYLTVEHIFHTAYRSWILCSGRFGRNGAIVEWDGSSETYNNIYDIQSTYPLSGVNYYEVPIVVNNRGLILEFDGNGFSPMIRNGKQIAFPCYSEVGNAFFASATIPAIAKRGMIVTDDGLIHINAGSPSIDTPKQLGGIWCINPVNGDFYSKYSLSDSDSYGIQSVSAPGAIQAINIPGLILNSIYMIAGGQIEVSGTSKSKIWVIKRQHDSTVKRGYFITEAFLLNDVQEIWDTIWAKFTAFRNSNDKIIIKAKGVRNLVEDDNRPVQKDIVWGSSTTIEVTLDPGDEALAVGDEIEVVGKNSAGLLAHITQISGAHGALQTCTIDETAPNTLAASTVRFERWKKLAVIDNNTKYFAPASIGIHSTHIQFKVELRGANMDYYMTDLIAQVRKQVDKKR